MGKNRRAIVYSVLWMALIFFFSSFSSEDSSEQSGKVVRFVLWIVRSLFGEKTATWLADAGIEFYIRKVAHFTEYAILGVLVARALFLNGAPHPALALVICAVYACLDEFHQFFVSGRSMELRDVCIDSSGALFGILVYVLGRTALKRVRKT